MKILGLCYGMQVKPHTGRQNLGCFESVKFTPNNKWETYWMRLIDSSPVLSVLAKQPDRLVNPYGAINKIKDS